MQFNPVNREFFYKALNLFKEAAPPAAITLFFAHTVTSMAQKANFIPQSDILPFFIRRDELPKLCVLKSDGLVTKLFTFLNYSNWGSVETVSYFLIRTCLFKNPDIENSLNPWILKTIRVIATAVSLATFDNFISPNQLEEEKNVNLVFNLAKYFCFSVLNERYDFPIAVTNICIVWIQVANTIRSCH